MKHPTDELLDGRHANGRVRVAGVKPYKGRWIELGAIGAEAFKRFHHKRKFIDEGVRGDAPIAKHIKVGPGDRRAHRPSH